VDRFLKIILFLCSFTDSHARLNVSKEFSFSVTQLEELHTNLETAVNRSPEMMKYPFMTLLESNKFIVLSCPPMMPNLNKKGCHVIFQVNEYLSIEKPLYLGNSLDRALSETQSTDPNTTEEHLHFGTLVEASDQSGTHYYCKPEGELRSKSWKCFWYLHESVQ